MKVIRYAILFIGLAGACSGLLQAAGFSGSLSPEVKKRPPGPAISTGLQPPVREKKDIKRLESGTGTANPIQPRPPAGGIAKPVPSSPLKAFKEPRPLSPAAPSPLPLPAAPTAAAPHGFKRRPAIPATPMPAPARAGLHPAPARGGFGPVPVPGKLPPAPGKAAGRQPAGSSNRPAGPAAPGGFAAPAAITPAATTGIDRGAITRNTNEFQRLKTALETARRTARERLARRRAAGRHGDDCDDTRADIYPGATEICDHADNNCDGRVDEGQTILVFRDADGDGHGAPGTGEDVCPADFRDAQTHGNWLSTMDNDCDDADPDQWHDCH